MTRGGGGGLHTKLHPFLILACAFAALAAGPAAAVPSFAVQTGQACQACHVGGFGPQLTPFGREFKMDGYTMRSRSFNVPISAMAVASYLRTLKGQPPPPGFRANDNVALDQVGLFIAGGLGSHFGAFVQNTYDGVARAFHWDNLDVRAVTTAKVGKTAMVLGFSLNNAPTVQDAFNTLTAWGFPYTASGLAPHPGAAPLVGSLAQDTLGLTGYAWINSQLYAEVGGYGSPSAGFLTHVGIDPFSPGGIDGIAPYGRLAYQKNYGDRNFEVGAFGMAANLYPGRDQSTGLTDHYTDLGVDASFQRFAKHDNVFTFNARYTYERQRLGASRALGLTRNPSDNLQELRADLSYYWRDKIGLTVGGFDTWGSRDVLLYAANRSLRPDSSGVTLQLDGTPFGGAGSPLGPRFNIRLGVQYTAYLRFNGAGYDYDGHGRGAADNNTFRVFTWIAY
ncbi:MAG: hypothetical protein ACYC8V_14750 [Caulobacteraceae bacterium]